jgi:4-aminobutyrate aminotransferase-like enzyme
VLAGRNNDTVPGYGNVLILSPPLILSREQADTIATVIQDALAKL